MAGQFECDECGGFIAQHNNLPGISAFGETLGDLAREIETLTGGIF